MAFVVAGLVGILTEVGAQAQPTSEVAPSYEVYYYCVIYKNEILNKERKGSLRIDVFATAFWFSLGNDQGAQEFAAPIVNLSPADAREKGWSVKLEMLHAITRDRRVVNLDILLLPADLQDKEIVPGRSEMLFSFDVPRFNDGDNDDGYEVSLVRFPIHQRFSPVESKGLKPEAWKRSTVSIMPIHMAKINNPVTGVPDSPERE